MSKPLPEKGSCQICTNNALYRQARSLIHIMTRMQPLSSNRDSDMEIVEDSEPERVQLRNQSRNSANDARLLQRNILASGMQQRGSNSAGLHTNATVIEISDSESSSSSHGKNAVVYGPCKAVHTVRDPQQESSTPIIDLKKFAFKPLPPKQVLPVNKLLEPQLLSEARPPERRRTPKNTHTGLDFSFSDFSRVSRCVCCSISWTTRKTTAQKLEHIQRCAKKNGLNDETVRILIQKERASPKESNVDLQKVPTTNSISTTLLEDLVQPRSNKRKNMRSGSHLVMGSPLREAILSRAKDIIAGPSPDEASPQPLAGRKLVSDFTTQAFTATTLIQASSKTSLFSATSQGDEDYSELRDKMLDTMSPWRNQPTLNPTVIGIGKLPPHSLSTATDIEQEELNKDNNQGPRDLIRKVPVQKSKKRRSSALDHRVPLNEDITPARNVRLRVRSSTKKKATFGKEWEIFMNERIREDNELNLRIIRYEPVDFHLFLKLAKAYAPSISDTTLKPHLRNFLDNQAIHFYEGNVWKR